MVGVDISGRHEEGGEYVMVAAAVAAKVDSARLRQVEGFGFAISREEPSLKNTLSVITDATDELPTAPSGPIVAERGEFYEEPAWSIASSLPGDTEFKYVETIAERRTVDTAHHAAYALRSLLLTEQYA